MKNALFRTHFTGVLSSTWRLSEKKTQEFFDADPFLAENFTLKTGKNKDSRSQEIQDWLKDSEYGAEHKYFIIIDDEDCSDLFPEENLVKTKTGQGLTPKTSRVMRDKILALEKKYNIPVIEKQEGFF